MQSGLPGALKGTLRREEETSRPRISTGLSAKGERRERRGEEVEKQRGEERRGAGGREERGGKIIGDERRKEEGDEEKREAGKGKAGKRRAEGKKILTPHPQQKKLL